MVSDPYVLTAHMHVQSTGSELRMFMNFVSVVSKFSIQLDPFPEDATHMTIPIVHTRALSNCKLQVKTNDNITLRLVLITKKTDASVPEDPDAFVRDLPQR